MELLWLITDSGYQIKLTFILKLNRNIRRKLGVWYRDWKDCIGAIDAFMELWWSEKSTSTIQSYSNKLEFLLWWRGGIDLAWCRVCKTFCSKMLRPIIRQAKSKFIGLRITSLWFACPLRWYLFGIGLGKLSAQDDNKNFVSYRIKWVSRALDIDLGELAEI